ncbi:hypothetical protein GCM10010232_49330 [Streptomyces amakusaensis]|uniref:asparagine synthase (glutamine-hydrolyzing) n=1 Tax=Streptomyces amakusaensis TaxID=67271 RepID=A0ABW0AN09_9ACTN
MCGIAGLAGGDAVRHRKTVAAMGGAQHYRGPDGTLHLTGWDGRAVLAMNTLLIVDPKAVPGPYLDQDTVLLLAFNGEIYNWRSQARAWGIEIGEREPDAHLVLRAWAKIGPSCLDGLDGMFALAVYDPRLTTLFLARDRLGEKPLYWRLDGGRLAFASEVSTLTGYGPAPLVLRPEVTAIETPAGVDTPFQGIQLLAPATLLSFDVTTGSIDQMTWWHPAVVRGHLGPLSRGGAPVVGRFPVRVSSVGAGAHGAQLLCDVYAPSCALPPGWVGRFPVSAPAGRQNRSGGGWPGPLSAWVHPGAGGVGLCSVTGGGPASSPVTAARSSLLGREGDGHGRRAGRGGGAVRVRWSGVVWSWSGRSLVRWRGRGGGARARRRRCGTGRRRGAGP